MALDRTPLRDRARFATGQQPHLRPPREQIAQTKTIPAPIGGLNAINAIAEMPETDAVILDNWFPTPSSVELRDGYVNWEMGLPSWVETLMGYSNATAEKLFAASGTAFYDVTAGGAVGGAVVTGLTNARWEYTNVATPGGQYLYTANAVDKPRLYDGTTWVAIDGASTPAITGVTTTKLRNPIVWKNRVWFVEDGSMRAWYLPTQSVGGAASSIDLGTIFRLGGQLHVIISASLSTASSFDSYICFVTTEGEIAVYAGTDPAQAAMFVLLGIYPIGKPVGRRCFFKSGDDTIIICSDGLVSLARLISTGRVKESEVISLKILHLITNDVAAYSGNFGWMGVVHPLGNKIIVNVPVSTNTTYYQYVMDQLNGSWCTYGKYASPWPAACFCVLGDNLYWGGNTIVAHADVGSSDNGAVITGSCLPAFSYMDNDRQKLFTSARIVFNATGNVSPLIGLNTDFQIKAPTGTVVYNASGYAVWGTDKWDTGLWGGGAQVRRSWQTIGGIGFAASVYFKVSSVVDTIEIYSIDYLYKTGGVF